MAPRLLVLALAASACLAACQRGDQGAATSAAKSPAAGGNSTADAAAAGRTAPPGSGLNGGLGSSSGRTALGAGPAASAAQPAQGSSNRTPRSAFGGG